MSDFARFREIRRLYAELLPEWMEEYRQTGNMYHDPYFDDLPMIFTPIESAVWSDIRNSGIPFYPQVPVLNYFIDFACPFLKIGIECDGKAWHDYELDKARDARLASAGWTIYRIEGHECMRILDDPWDEVDEIDPQAVHKWFMTTSTGIVYAIKQHYFQDERSRFSKDNEFLVTSTLFEHRSTPYIDVTPLRVKRVESKPVLVRDYLAEYMALIERRMARVRG